MGIEIKPVESAYQQVSVREFNIEGIEFTIPLRGNEHSPFTVPEGARLRVPEKDLKLHGITGPAKDYKTLGTLLAIASELVLPENTVMSIETAGENTIITLKDPALVQLASLFSFWKDGMLQLAPDSVDAAGFIRINGQQWKDFWKGDHRVFGNIRFELAE